MTPTLTALCGSLRAASSSSALLDALTERLSGRAEVVRADIEAVPHYNADRDGGSPVAALMAAIERADGLLFVTPEYNYSVPGVLKNAIDWASRPAYASVFVGKPCFVISVSGGALGGVRAQSHLKYVLNGMLADVFPAKEVVVPHANAKLENGRFADAGTLDFALDGLAPFLARLSEGRVAHPRSATG